MKHIIQFSYDCSDPILEIESPYTPAIGDTVNYELTGTEKNYKNIVKWNDNSEHFEGVITLKWVDLNDKKIIWLAFMEQKYFDKRI